MNEEEILEKIRPSPEEREKINQVVLKCTHLLEARIREKELQAHVVLTGSIAKDTWISGDKNIDIFVIFPHEYTESQLKEYGLTIGKLFSYEIAYAEHPYVRNFYDGYEIDVVPAYQFKEGIRSSVDRTPLHTEYVMTHLKDRDQVRFLKKFTRSVGVYGSDLKVQGLSGYLCELLVIKFRTFKSILQKASDWKLYQPPLYLEKPPQKAFSEPFVFIDPVDSERNVAAVLSEENFTKFVYYSREYIKNPDPSYFFREPERYTRSEGTELLRIDFHVQLIDDILFPQLRKAKNFLEQEVERNGFRVFNSAVFDSGILLELSVFELPPFKKHTGPPIGEREHCDRFLEKHKKIGFGNGKIYAVTKRKYTRAYDLVRDLLTSKKGFGKDLTKAEYDLTTVSGGIDVVIY